MLPHRRILGSALPPMQAQGSGVHQRELWTYGSLGSCHWLPVHSLIGCLCAFAQSYANAHCKFQACKRSASNSMHHGPRMPSEQLLTFAMGRVITVSKVVYLLMKLPMDHSQIRRVAFRHGAGSWRRAGQCDRPGQAVKLEQVSQLHGGQAGVPGGCRRRPGGALLHVFIRPASSVSNAA